jgi:hypothetical protein
MNLRDFFKAIAVIAVSPWKFVFKPCLVEVFPKPGEYVGLLVNDPFCHTNKNLYLIVREFDDQIPHRFEDGHEEYINNDRRNKWFVKSPEGAEALAWIDDPWSNKEYQLGFRFFKEV